MATASLRFRPPSGADVTQILRSDTSSEFLPANADRRGATIENAAPGPLFVRYGGTASPSDYSVKLPPWASFEVPFPSYTGQIVGVWASAGSGQAMVTEVLQ